MEKHEPHQVLDFEGEKVLEQQKIESLPSDSSESLAIDPVLNRRITRKFDRHVVPWLFGLWLLAFIDRSNIGNANIDGLPKDLKLKGNKFNIVRAETRCNSGSYSDLRGRH